MQLHNEGCLCVQLMASQQTTKAKGKRKLEGNEEHVIVGRNAFFRFM